MTPANDIRLNWRPAMAEDEAFCFLVYASTRAGELAALGWDPAQQEIFLKMQFAAQTASYRAAFPGASRAIVLRDEQAVGTLMVDYAGKEIRLIDIAFLPAYRGAGLGTEIIRRLQTEARHSGRPLRLQVLRTNPAVRLYARLGFVATAGDEMRMEMVFGA